MAAAFTADGGQGFAHGTRQGTERRAADPLTAPVHVDGCGC
ncbi:hypothetical protein ACVV2G_12260 [Streptomyces ziwulingensis]